MSRDKWGFGGYKKNPKEKYPRRNIDPWTTITVQLVRKDKIVKLSREEWDFLQDYVENHKVKDLDPQEYCQLSPKIRAVIHDWAMQARSEDE